jgi:hypothetical protein
MARHYSPGTDPQTTRLVFSFEGGKRREPQRHKEHKGVFLLCALCVFVVF